MQHTVTTSADGSSTLQLTQFGEAYHSTNGAYTEATHIYIRCGMEHLFRNIAPACTTEETSSGPMKETSSCSSYATTGTPAINIFDVGLGTGLNCILAWAWQQQLRQRGLPYPSIHYWGIEKYPIPLSEIEQLNYPNIIAQHTSLLPDNLSEVFHFMHKCQWEENVAIPEIPYLSHSGNKYTSECAPTETNTHLGNKYTSECAPTQEIHHSGNISTPICAPNDNTSPSGEDCREDDFILHKTCADIAVLKAEFYRKACSREEKDPSGNSATATIQAVVFYDTFSPATQPELWDESIFRNIAAGCPAGSVLVTYCSKGTVKQALRNAGFTLERLAGPPGKRHILRGTL